MLHLHVIHVNNQYLKIIYNSFSLNIKLILNFCQQNITQQNVISMSIRFIDS